MLRSTRFASIVLAMLGMLVFSAAAWAQPGPGMGFGMFGGGPAASVSMQYGRLINMPTVQKELELVDDQKTKIKEVSDKAQAARRELMMGMQDAAPEERQAKMEEIGKKMQAQQDELKKVIESTLLPNQLKRLKEIALQVAGTQALNDKQIQDDLKLTSDQVAKIKTIGEDSMKKIRDLFSEGGDPQSAFPKIQEIRQDVEKQIVGVLTDEQKASLEKMKGQKLEIPASELGGRGGFRGGPGGPGGPGRGN
jgi:Spy/CpxP family protein refolding chaperone